MRAIGIAVRNPKGGPLLLPHTLTARTRYLFLAPKNTCPAIFLDLLDRWIIYEIDLERSRHLLSMSPPRGRYWCWTLNNPSPEEEKGLPDTAADACVYLIFGRETGATGTPHLQGYLELPTKLRRGGVAKLQGLSRAHLELRQGTQEQAITYCKKEGDFVDFGTPVASKQGRRSDLDSIKHDIDEGKSMEFIADTYFADFVRYYKGLSAYINTKPAPFRLSLTVTVIHGPSGTGKTRLVYEREPNLYICADSSLQWFDGYNGEEAVLIDDFRGVSFARAGFLLQLLDIYPLRVPIKGSFAVWKPLRIYITSNNAPPFCSDLGHELAPILRRITKIIDLQEPVDFNDPDFDIEKIFND